MRGRRMHVAVLAAIGCHHPAASTPAPVPAGNANRPDAAASSTTSPAPACLSPTDPSVDGKDADVDGDGIADRVVSGYRDVTIYVRRGDCLHRLTQFDADGHVAFVDVIEKDRPGMRDLSIDTWLFHGDRKRSRWFWDGTTYVSLGGDEDIPGPGRFPHH